MSLLRRRSIPARRSLGIVGYSQSYSERLFFVRRTPRACHGGCARLRPGSLRASHAVCLRYSTLEPAICARKESDIESVSTTGRRFEESLVMRGDFFDIRTVLFGFSSESRHCIPRLSPRNSNLDEVTANNALQRTATAVTAPASGLRLSPTAQEPRQPPRSLSLGSLGVSRRSIKAIRV